MAAPDFVWLTYEVSAAAGVKAVAPAADQVTIPDLRAWPRAVDKLRILLQTGAEVEHALLVQYLYAAFSLKSVREVADHTHKAALRAWNRLLVKTAREEMGHLMTVQNLLLAARLAPNLEREDFPPRKDLYPFALHLEPLTRRSLAKYVTAEAPRDADIDEIVAIATEAAGAPVNRVGAVYGLLGVIFSTAQELIDGGSGSDEWDAMLRLYASAAYAQDADAPSWHLSDDVVDATTLGFQGDASDWFNMVPIHRIADRVAARTAIMDVALQGEGPSSAAGESHFERYRNMFDGTKGVPRFPPDDFVATLPVPVDPAPASYPQSRTRQWAELADVRYGLMLGFIEHYLSTSDTADRARLAEWAMAEMRRLTELNGRLTTLPSGDGGGVAAVGFGLPAELNLPPTAAQRWTLHRARTEAALTAVVSMRELPADADDAVLITAHDDDVARLAQMPAG
jgi:Ferritin-like